MTEVSAAIIIKAVKKRISMNRRKTAVRCKCHPGHLHYLDSPLAVRALCVIAVTARVAASTPDYYLNS